MKYRYKVLVEDVGSWVRELVRQTCDAFEIEILKGVVSKGYLHILISAPPNMIPGEIMCWIKGCTSRRLFEEYLKLKKRYWSPLFSSTALPTASLQCRGGATWTQGGMVK